MCPRARKSRTVMSQHNFACETCGLELDEWDLIEAAGLPADFPAEGSAADVFEEEYGND
jgi:hypothetical protein